MCEISLVVTSWGYSSLSVRAPCCSGFSCGEQALGVWASVVAASGLCSRWVLSRSEIEPVLLLWQAD